MNTRVFDGAFARRFAFGVIALVATAAFAFPISLCAQDFGSDHDDGFGFGYGYGHSEFHDFFPGSIVLSGTVYVGRADTVIPGEVLPPGCLNTGTVTNPTVATVNVPLLPADQTKTATTTAVTVTCGYASDNGEAPNLHDTHNVWNNAATDGSFGVSSPIVLWDLSTDGFPLGELNVPSHEIVTSFSSKSELALNRSADGRSLTFMGYRGGPGCPALTLDSTTNILTQGTNVGPVSPTAPNLIDVSASSTPGLCDPTNAAVASYEGANNPTAYYRSVAEVDARGHIFYTDGDAYSGDNSRAVIEADNGLYYSVGNDNSGGLSKKQMPETQLGIDLSHSTGAELYYPGAAPLVPPANNMISYLCPSRETSPARTPTSAD